MLKYFALVMAVIAFAAGVYITFFQSAGFVKTQATIVSIVEVPSDLPDETSDHPVTVDYDGYRKLTSLLTGKVAVLSTDYGEKVKVNLAVPHDEFEVFKEKLNAAYGGKPELNVEEEIYYRF